MVQARALLAAIALTVTVPSVAEARSEKQVRRDCTSDALTYCAGSIPSGRSAIIKCMVQNRTKLSPQCRRHING